MDNLNGRNTIAPMTAAFSLAAVGDIAFEGRAADRPDIETFGDVAHIFRGANLSVANLECALTTGGRPIPGKCTLRGSPLWAGILKQAGIGVVSLANNHVMDYGPAGLASTLEALRDAGIQSVGAGSNIREARAPLFVDVGGTRVAFLARTSVIVSAPTCASDTEPGVAWLDPGEARAAIAACRDDADVVVMLVHWGIEEYAYPSPTQRADARGFVDAGADIVLGHHPHVLQGFERYKNGWIAYSLGNFLFDEFEWCYDSPEDGPMKQWSTLSEANRQGLITTIEWSGAGTPAVSSICTRIDPAGRVRVDEAGTSRRTQVAQLSAALARSWYHRWWQLYAIRREWDLRMSERLSLRRALGNLHRIRPRHLINMAVVLKRSGRMVSETTTNPYE